MKKLRACVVGAGGYGGAGITELLLSHPSVETAALVDKADVGAPMSALYPNLKGFVDMPLLAPDDPSLEWDFDVVFCATPDGVGQSLAPALVEKGVRVVDFSGDFRFDSAAAYADYAERIGRPKIHASADLLAKSAYGLTELHREAIAGASVVGNPGCLAVSSILGLAPALARGLVEKKGIVCDCKTGVSGAGKKPTPQFHYPARYEAVNAYKIGGHQHVVEIERELRLVAGGEVQVTFVPHVVPATRGILTTLYATLAKGVSVEQAQTAYEEFYREEYFVRVFPPGTQVSTSQVRGSNFCHMSVNVDRRTDTLIVVSVIDNLVKGQAGSALQNMNVMFGLDERLGLTRPGLYP